MLECSIVKARRDFTVDVEFSVGSTRLGLFGPSGSGKSTLLSCLAGLETPDSGHIRWRGQSWFPPPLPVHRRSLGYLTQKDRLFPHLSVAENILFALDAKARRSQDSWVQEIQGRLGLAGLWDRPPRELSGGQTRRVAVARALCRRPELVLLDEPFAGLDRPLARELTGVLTLWQKELGFTLLAVDHDPAVLKSLCPDVIVIEHGCVVRRGSWQDLAAEQAGPTGPALLDSP